MSESRLIKEGNGIVYHYTSLETLLKILDGTKDNQFLFHGTDIFSMNDPTEFLHGFTELWSILPVIENELYQSIKNAPQTYNINESFLDNKFRLSNMWKRLNESNDSCLKTYIETIHKSYVSPFVISLSCNGDCLPMWVTYGDHGYGVAMGMDIQAYYKKRSLDDGTTLLDFTSYDKRELHSILVTYDKISINHPLAIYARFYIVKYLRSIPALNIDDESLLKLQMNALDSITILASAMIKNMAYRYEEESRLVSFKQDENDVKYKLSSTKKLLPYIHVAISTSKLKKIVIGPCCDYNNIKFALKKRLEQLGIPLKDEDIEKSIVPYRIF